MRTEWRDAAIAGDVGRMERLLAEGEAVDGRDRYGQTALMLAALHGRKAVVDFLLDNHADLDVTAKFGLSALMLAIINRHAEIAASLIDAGANTRLLGAGASGFWGKTAGDLAKEGGLMELAAAIAQAER